MNGTRVATGIAAVALTAAALASASPAQAVTSKKHEAEVQAAFLAELTSRGVPVADLPEKNVIDAGYTMCNALTYEPAQQVATEFYLSTPYSVTLSLAWARVWVDSATATICPWHAVDRFPTTASPHRL